MIHEINIHVMLLTAREAAERLGVKVETLYAYVSRGRLHSVAVPGSRERHYRPEDIDALRAARGGARDSPEPAAEALMPVIDSSTCLIEDGRLYYRGIDALQLSDTATLEEVAALLWAEDVSSRMLDPHPASARASATLSPNAGEDKERIDLIERCQRRLAEFAAADLGAYDLSHDGVARSGWRILGQLVACVAGDAEAPGQPAHLRLATCWGLDEGGADIIRRCLVLLADHELNASTFVARCVASTAATPYAVVSAALGALSGERHGGATVRAEAVFHELRTAGDPLAGAADRLARGEAMPGIGHPLYPDGDPRAVAILYALSAIVPDARRLVYWRPNVDLALAAAATVLRLPQGAALSLFVIGRTVGWIAHAIEQYASGVLIRPRARYTGPPPQR